MSARGASVAYADTSLFLALLAGPSHPLHEGALELLRRVSEGQLSLIVTPIVVAELVYSAKGVLRWSRADTATRLGAMLDSDGLQVRDLSVIQAALQLYRDHPRLDYPDAYLAATAALTGPPAVASFDRAFDVIEGIARTTA
jgi:predicted nucleic acid-binding protein